MAAGNDLARYAHGLKWELFPQPTPRPAAPRAKGYFTRLPCSTEKRITRRSFAGGVVFLLQLRRSTAGCCDRADRPSVGKSIARCVSERRNLRSENCSRSQQLRSSNHFNRMLTNEQGPSKRNMKFWINATPRRSLFGRQARPTGAPRADQAG